MAESTERTYLASFELYMEPHIPNCVCDRLLSTRHSSDIIS